MIKAYRKTATIKAEQFDGSDEMVDEYDIEVVEGDYAEDYSMPEAGPAPYFRYFMPSGYNEVYVGDWVATGVNDEHWAIADDVFKKTYAELPTINKGIAHLIELTKQDGKSLGDMFVDYAPKQLTDTDEDMISNWVHDTKNKTVLSNKLARAWLDGYVVEEEK